ncbi:MAG: FAD-dependent oxidoreductase [Deltaproteobacteria bacterium]|nr:FAD-dependent oxidoreductase [Deltaproteobacteria bacterium]
MPAMSADLSAPFLPISGYLDALVERQPALAGDARADVAIVGGGLTGLSTALALRRAGVDVVILEREFCGFGASGRNAGHLTPTIGKDLPTLLMMYGEARTAAIVRFADHCVRRTESVIAEHGIDCDYAPSGNVMAVVHPKQEKRLRRGAEVAAKVGAPVRFLESDEMRARGLPPAFLCGALEGAGGTLDPGKLVRGLRRAALAAGVRIHEDTRVVAVATTPSPVVRTTHGTLRAERVVMASNAWTREIGAPGNRMLPLYVTLFETAPLSDAQLAALGGWPQREGIYTAHEVLESYRLSARRTIVGGSKMPRYVWGGRPGAHGGPDAACQSVVARGFRDRFPALADLPIAHFWGGWIAMTLNFLPSIGALGSDGRLWHALGYNGHGVAQATAVGDILADGITGRDNEWARVFRKPAPPLPPEPFLWLTARGLLALFGGIDRITDRQIRAAAPR